MGSTLYRTYARIGLITALLLPMSQKAHALAVECAGCVAATNAVQTAVETGNAKLDSILTELGTIKNYLNQIRLAVGPAVNTTSVGTLSQAPDFLNMSSVTPTIEPFSLDKGAEIDFSNLTGLKDKLNEALRIYNTAKRTKEALENGKVLESPEELLKVVIRRRKLLADSIERTISTGLYSLSQTDSAKTKELSLDQSRRSATNLQLKIQSMSKTQGELLSRMNHLIALIAAQNTLNGANYLDKLPREDPEVPPPPRASGNPGDATRLFNGGTQ